MDHICSEKSDSAARWSFCLTLGAKHIFFRLLQFAENTLEKGSAYSSFIVAFKSCFLFKKVLISLFQIPVKLASLVNK